MEQNGADKPLEIVKMHGLGNDFVIIDSRGADQCVTAPLARALGDRNRGVGYDQLAELRDSGQADLALTFWNRDGSQAGACGNATRCVADIVMRDLNRHDLSLQTAQGVLRAIRTETGEISVNMGPPQLDWDQIPLARALDTDALPLPGTPAAVGMGNPHCVFFVDDADATDPAQLGPQIEHDPLFPEGTNVEFAQVRGPHDIRMRVWERGTGITLACGSGACATLVAAHRRGLCAANVRMELDGGWLALDWRDDGVWMTGPTMEVFRGQITPQFLNAV